MEVGGRGWGLGDWTVFSEQTAAAEEEKTQRLASNIQLSDKNTDTGLDAVLSLVYLLAVHLCDGGSGWRVLAVMEGDGEGGSFLCQT